MLDQSQNLGSPRRQEVPEATAGEPQKTQEHRQSALQSKYIYVEAVDGEGNTVIQRVETEVAMLSPFLQREVLNEGNGFSPNNPMKLPKQVNKEVLELLVGYCDYHRAPGRSDKERKAFDERFIRIDTRRLCELTSAADALDMKPLVDLASRALARLIEGKTPEQIRATFHLPDDLTEEEKLEPIKNLGEDMRIRLLNRLYAKRRKELADRKCLPDAESGTHHHRQQDDTRSVDELLSFIEADEKNKAAAAGQAKSATDLPVKHKKRRGKKKAGGPDSSSEHAGDAIRTYEARPEGTRGQDAPLPVDKPHMRDNGGECDEHDPEVDTEVQDLYRRLQFDWASRQELLSRAGQVAGQAPEAEQLHFTTLTSLASFRRAPIPSDDGEEQALDSPHAPAHPAAAHCIDHRTAKPVSGPGRGSSSGDGVPSPRRRSQHPQREQGLSSTAGISGAPLKGGAGQGQAPSRAASQSLIGEGLTDEAAGTEAVLFTSTAATTGAANGVPAPHHESEARGMQAAAHPVDQQTEGRPSLAKRIGRLFGVGGPRADPKSPDLASACPSPAGSMQEHVRQHWDSDEDDADQQRASSAPAGVACSPGCNNQATPDVHLRTASQVAAPALEHPVTRSRTVVCEVNGTAGSASPQDNSVSKGQLPNGHTHTVPLDHGSKGLRKDTDVAAAMTILQQFLSQAGLARHLKIAVDESGHAGGTDTGRDGLIVLQQQQCANGIVGVHGKPAVPGNDREPPFEIRPASVSGLLPSGSRLHVHLEPRA